MPNPPRREHAPTPPLGGVLRRVRDATPVAMTRVGAHLGPAGSVSDSTAAAAQVFAQTPALREGGSGGAPRHVAATRA